MDLQKSREPSQCYVALSRVQELSQVFIIDKLNEDCAGWTVSQSALDELDRSLQNAENTQTQEDNELEIMCLNVRSLRKHFKDVEQTVRGKNFSILCLQETWLSNNDNVEDYQLENFTCDLTSRGKGKGIATYYPSCFEVSDRVCDDDCQFVILTSDKISVINVYRSSSCKNFCLLLKKRLDLSMPTLICGDFNIDYRDDGNAVVRFLKDKLKLRQLVLESTHEKGSILDQVWINGPLIGKVQVERKCLRFSDHDILKIIVNQEKA